jgi:hypothetical protein
MKLQSLLSTLAIGGSAMLLSLPVTQLALASTQTPNTQPTEIIDFGSLKRGEAGVKPIVFTVPLGDKHFRVDSDLRPFSVHISNGGGSGVVGATRNITMFADLSGSDTRELPLGDHQKLVTVTSGATDITARDTLIKKVLLKVKILNGPIIANPGTGQQPPIGGGDPCVVDGKRRC